MIGAGLQWTFAASVQPAWEADDEYAWGEPEHSARCDRCGYSVPLQVYTSVDGLLSEITEHNARMHPVVRPPVDPNDLLRRPWAYDEADALCVV